MIKTMNTAFLETITDRKELLRADCGIINKFLLENNLNQIEEIQKFFISDNPVMLINGFLGTGKGQVADYSISLLKSDVIVLKYKCFETTILDDILLSFFEEFKNLVVQNVIKPPKVKSENFTQKVNSYFSVIEKPVLVVIDSLEAVLKDNRTEILDFIFYLSLRKNIKTIFISRVFDYNEFEGRVPYSRTTILALDKSLFEKLLRSEGIKLIGPVSDELYRYSRGYFFYTMLSLKLIKARNLNLIDFLKGFTRSFLSYNDFILREALSFVDPVSGHLFRFLTIMRHPVSDSLLKTLSLYDEERINFFVENYILSSEKNMIYLPDYYKDIFMNSIPESVALKIHKSCIDLYNTQLPLKPFERDLLISRQTMRAEIDYHGMFLPKVQTPVSAVNPTVMESVEYAAESVLNEEEHILEESPDEKIKHISFIFETEEDEKKIMNEIANSINKYIDYSNKTLNADESGYSLSQLVNAAKSEENKYNYKKAIAFYQRALLKKDDDDFYTFLPLVYTKLAKNFSSLADWFNALRYYDFALEFYTAAGDNEKIAAMKLEIANIFYVTFKHDKAKLLLSEIIASNGINSEILIKAYIALANLSNTDARAVYSYCKKALELVDTFTDKAVLAELYFKSAVVCDDLDDTESAVKYYKKCIEIDKNNPNLSSAYANLALIFDESGYAIQAEKYYLKSLELDSIDKNYNGMYFSSLKLAELNRKKAPDKAMEYFKKSVEYAGILKEPFYQASAMIELGDFYASRGMFKISLENYYDALGLAKMKASSDNVSRIEHRIADIKVRLGEDEFIKLEKEILNER